MPLERAPASPPGTHGPNARCKGFAGRVARPVHHAGGERCPVRATTTCVLLLLIGLVGCNSGGGSGGKRRTGAAGVTSGTPTTPTPPGTPPAPGTNPLPTNATLARVGAPTGGL